MYIGIFAHFISDLLALGFCKSILSKAYKWMGNIKKVKYQCEMYLALPYGH